MNNPTQSGLLLAAIAYSGWAFLAPGNAVMLEYVGPFWMQIIRAAIAVALLAMWKRGAWVGEGLKLLRNPGIFLALVTGTFLSFTLFALAQTRIPPGEATLAFFFAPLWTALVGWWLLRERVRPSFWLWSILSIVGAVIALGPGTNLDAIGIALGVGSGIGWAFYAVLLRRYAPDAAGGPLLFSSLVVALAGFLLLSPMDAAVDWDALDSRFWLWTAIQVAVPTIIAIQCYQAALKRVAAASVNLFVGLELVGAFLLSWMLFGDVPSTVQFVGIGIALAAVTGFLLGQTRPRNQSRTDSHVG